MAQQLYFTRDTKMFLVFNGYAWHIPILDGFSFSQATNSSEICVSTEHKRATELRTLIDLANELQPIERKIQDCICSSARVASGSLRLAFLTALTFILRWPDWQLTSLFARGFKVSGLIDP